VTALASFAAPISFWIDSGVLEEVQLFIGLDRTTEMPTSLPPPHPQPIKFHALRVA
jgi:hypothetical protein